MQEVNGYVALIIGSKPPYYRMVFLNSLNEHKKVFSGLKKEAEGLHQRIELFRMINGDTQVSDNDMTTDLMNE